MSTGLDKDPSPAVVLADVHAMPPQAITDLRLCAEKYGLSFGVTEASESQDVVHSFGSRQDATREYDCDMVSAGRVPETSLWVPLITMDSVRKAIAAQKSAKSMVHALNRITSYGPAAKWLQPFLLLNRTRETTGVLAERAEELAVNHRRMLGAIGIGEISLAAMDGYVERMRS